VDVEVDAAHRPGSRQQQQPRNCPQEDQDQSRIEEQPARTIKEQEAQVPPAVAPTAQVGRTIAPVRGKRSGHLVDSHFEECGFHHHLAGEFHAGGAKVHELVRRLAEAAQTAMEVSAGGFEKQAPDAGENGIPEILVQGWHGTGLNAAQEAIAHHQLTSLAQFLQQSRHISEVVAAVGIAHDDISAARGADPAHQGTAVSFARDADNANT